MARKNKRDVDEVIESVAKKIMSLPDTDEQNEAAKEMLLFGSGIKVGRILTTVKQSTATAN